jgi:hypothetical protein
MWVQLTSRFIEFQTLLKFDLLIQNISKESVTEFTYTYPKIGRYPKLYKNRIASNVPSKLGMHVRKPWCLLNSKWFGLGNPGVEGRKLSTKVYKTKLRGFSPQANYTDRATAACRLS